MDKRDLKKEFLMYTSLNILGMVGLSCYILADTFFVSNGLGINGLTALNLAIPIYSLIRGVGLMLYFLVYLLFQQYFFLIQSRLF